MASKENQEKLDTLKNKHLNYCDDCAQRNDCKWHDDICVEKKEADELINNLQQAIDENEKLIEKNKMLEKALYDACYELAYRQYNNDSNDVRIEYHAHMYKKRYLGELENGK